MVDTLRSLARPGGHKAFDDDEARKKVTRKTTEEEKGPRAREKCNGEENEGGGEEGEWCRERDAASSWHPGRT